VLTQLRSFMGQLDANKASIIATLENTNRLALQIRRNDGAIKAALDDIPDALRSVDSQRADLVKLLRALTRLSGVGVRVIRASKESTINSLRHLGPVLEGFAKAGDNFAKSFQVFATYPFIDEAVGRSPRVARNLHMGDYTNLSVNLDINSDLLNPLEPVCEEIDVVREQVKDGIRDQDYPTELENALLALANTADCDELTRAGGFVTDELLEQVCGTLPDAVCAGGVLKTPTLPKLPKVPKTPGNVTGDLGLPRAQLGNSYQQPQPIDPFGLATHGLDAGLGTVLLQGVAEVR